MQPQSIVVAPQGEVTLRCEPRDSSTQILWVFNGEFILSSARDGLEITHGRLHIRSFRHRRSDGRNQAGVYQCIARNSVGAVISREAIVQQACEYSVICNCLSSVLQSIDDVLVLLHPISIPESLDVFPSMFTVS